MDNGFNIKSRPEPIAFKRFQTIGSLPAEICSYLGWKFFIDQLPENIRREVIGESNFVNLNNPNEEIKSRLYVQRFNPSAMPLEVILSLKELDAEQSQQKYSADKGVSKPQSSRWEKDEFLD